MEDGLISAGESLFDLIQFRSHGKVIWFHYAVLRDTLTSFVWQRRIQDFPDGDRSSRANFVI